MNSKRQGWASLDAADDAFNYAYAIIASQGLCDLPGGKEYGRVRARWVDFGRPLDVDAFIRKHANQAPRRRKARAKKPAQVSVTDLARGADA